MTPHATHATPGFIDFIRSHAHTLRSAANALAHHRRQDSASMLSMNSLTAPPRRRQVLLLGTLAFGAMAMSACGPDAADERAGKDHAAGAEVAARTDGRVVTIQDTTISATMDVAGVAEPVRQATLSTKWMGSVTEVLVREGDVVREGQTLLRIDARELSAKSSQVAASLADADAMYANAATNAARFTALYNDSAATRAQYDAAVTGLARADAARNAARAAALELDAMSSYATIRAPFAGVVTARLVDPGAFAAPGAPLVTIQDVSSLRLSVTSDARAVGSLRRGQSIDADIDGEPVTAIVEGVIPAGAGNLFTVNATVINRTDAAGQRRYRAGSSAQLHLPAGSRLARLVPREAIVTDGDLTGVIVRGTDRDERRWVRLGTSVDGLVDVTSGLRAGEQIVVPGAAPSASGA